MWAPVVHILPSISILRERLLPVPGRVSVRAGQRVNSVDVVAEARCGQGHLLIDVACLLGMRAEAAQRLIRVKAGDLISQGDGIARRPGLFPRTLRASRSGQVVLTGAGRILMEVGETTLELRAGMPGIVRSEIPDRGVEIAFTGALVQGVWGNGQMDLGLLPSALPPAEEPLAASQLDVSLRGAVALAGYCDDPSLLQMAGELPVRGMILGSMSPGLIPQALQMSYPIIVVDGFGQRPMNAAAYRLFTANIQAEVTLNAVPFNLQTGVRPEIFIPAQGVQEAPLPVDVTILAPEQTVRLWRNPFGGVIGTIINLRPGLTTMPSGLRTAAAEVKLESGEQILVPPANLEVVG